MFPYRALRGRRPLKVSSASLFNLPTHTHTHRYGQYEHRWTHTHHQTLKKEGNEQHRVISDVIDCPHEESPSCAHFQRRTQITRLYFAFFCLSCLVHTLWLPSWKSSGVCVCVCVCSVRAPRPKGRLWSYARLLPGKYRYIWSSSGIALIPVFMCHTMNDR